MPYSECDQTTFISKYVDELAEKKAAVFVGAGLSCSSGYVDWKKLLAPLAKELQVDIDREQDMPALAQYYQNEKSGQRPGLTTMLMGQFSTLKTPSKSHEIIARLPISKYWTTNYDRLIETALSNEGRITEAKHSVGQLSHTAPTSDATIYKIHGDIDHPHLAILTKGDYECYHRTHEQFVSELKTQLSNITFCFVGYGFGDPNINQIISHLRLLSGASGKTHFRIARRHKRASQDTDSSFRQATLKQGFEATELMRLNVETVYVDEYADIPLLLLRVEQSLRARTIFISGSANEYGDWTAGDALRFIAELSGQLVARGFKLSTGCGVGVGGAVITGAVREIYRTNGKVIAKSLDMNPFPITISDRAERSQIFTQYRKDILRHAGIAMFLFGNENDGNILDIQNEVFDAGVMEEFELAHSAGLKILPVGATGYQSDVIWRKINDSFGTYHSGASAKFLNLFSGLRQTSHNDSKDHLIPLIVEAACYLRDTT